ncbi:MAG: HNH endonuclease [Desulfobacteraceae bacterium]|nr:HNH endonuclease [Desulfobacteraceae bacterium]
MRGPETTVDDNEHRRKPMLVGANHGTEAFRQLLLTLFHYNPDTGQLIRLQAAGNAAKIGDVVGNICDRKQGMPRIQVMIDGKNYMAHRLIWLMVTGSWPIADIDHRDGNSLNNRWLNLREASPLINSQNSSTSTRNTSGRIGVSKRRKGWVASIQVSGKRLHLGDYPDFDSACKARERAEKKYGFHSNHGRPSRTHVSPGDLL